MTFTVRTNFFYNFFKKNTRIFSCNGWLNTSTVNFFYNGFGNNVRALYVTKSIVDNRKGDFS